MNSDPITERWAIRDKDKWKLVTRKELVKLEALTGTFTPKELRGYLVFPNAQAAFAFIEKHLKSSNRFEPKKLR